MEWSNNWSKILFDASWLELKEGGGERGGKEWELRWRGEEKRWKVEEEEVSFGNFKWVWDTVSEFTHIWIHLNTFFPLFLIILCSTVATETSPVASCVWICYLTVWSLLFGERLLNYGSEGSPVIHYCHPVVREWNYSFLVAPYSTLKNAKTSQWHRT